jgi:hypothetical protein
MTTYGVSELALSRPGAVTAACKADDEMGAMCAVYDAGMDIPVANHQPTLSSKSRQIYASRTSLLHLDIPDSAHYPQNYQATPIRGYQHGQERPNLAYRQRGFRLDHAIPAPSSLVA